MRLARDAERWVVRRGMLVRGPHPDFVPLQPNIEDPYSAGWIAKVRISDDSGLDKLLDHDTYQKQCAEEG